MMKESKFMNNRHTSTEELLALLCDQEPLSPSAQQHLDHCPRCQQQMADYQETATYLLLRLYRCNCPSAATLSALYLPGVLTDAERYRILKHLTLCPLCSSELAEIGPFLEAS